MTGWEMDCSQNRMDWKRLIANQMEKEKRYWKKNGEGYGYGRELVGTHLKWEIKDGF